MSLPLLHQRLRREELDRLSRRIGAPPSLEAAEGVLAEAEDLIRRLERELVSTSPGRDGVREWLRKQGAGVQDQLATFGTLGLDVVRERTAVAIEAAGIDQELTLLLLVGHVRGAVPAAVLACLRSRRWQVRRAALEVLASRGGEDHVAEVRALANAPDEHFWVRDAADAVLVAADPDAGLIHLLAGLIPRTDDRHCLLRGLRLQRLFAGWTDAHRHVVALDDPSEHVSIQLAELLTQGDLAAARPALHHLAADARPRVRAAVAEHLGRNATRAPDVVAELIGERLAVEFSPSALRPLSRAAARAALVSPTHAAPLQHALDRVIAADVAGDSTDAAAHARRVCVRAADPLLARLYDRLSAVVPTIAPGSSRRYTWAKLDIAAPPPDALGAVLSELAHEDHGLGADLDARGVTIYRGDSFRPRAWRALHELLHPAPNKRQSWSHLVGRVRKGALRAPPGQMAEVTATTTPGERTVIDRDGSWVPALPTVDDVLDVRGGARIYSALGVTEVAPPASFTRRILNRARLLTTYPRLARLRSAAIAADAPSERASYVRTLGGELGVEVRFVPAAPPPRRATELFSSAAPLLAWLSETRDAVLAPSQVSQPALAWFTAGMLAIMLGQAAARRDAIRVARAHVPLVIGGWGTRGKSGTERIKAGLFHGLGYPVFVKTTGCEAMFISARPGLPAREIFIYRPHDKSSIWEQAVMLEQAAGMKARVMLWECMALRPAYVQILEQDWMRDDLVTLTNAFPDHEDIQGPAGHDVASVISTFIPKRSVALTSEREFLPVFRDRARANGTELDAVDPIEAELLGQDLLDLFPYQEHPRNIALVARMAERLGVPRTLAIATMAEHVVPDLGVLRIYPEVRVCGRRLRFINGMSANERTGCVTNWRRTGCDQISADTNPDQAIVVVVNNRADRVARSEVFARILVQDLSADAAVLIGTNLTGLVGFIHVALDAALAELQLRPPGSPEGHAEARVATWLARVRIGKPSAAALVTRATLAIEAAGHTLADAAALRTRLDALLSNPGDGLDLEPILAQILADSGLRATWEGPPLAAPPPLPEVALRCAVDDAWRSWADGVAKQVLHARLLAKARSGTLDDATFRGVYRALFLRSLHVVEDPATSGDRIITLAARAAPAGARVTVMGVQNIKGTGLDFAYRWVALGFVAPRVEHTRAPNAIRRLEALRQLETFDDYGLVDAGLAAAHLATPVPDEDEDERALRERMFQRVSAIHAARLDRLDRPTVRRWWAPIVAFVEALVDPLDAMRRAWLANRTLARLRRNTISLGDAAETMQELTTRQKGGWLAKWIVGR